MSILRSYINKNNTIISNSYVNTGRNPVIELNFGASDLIVPNFGYTRFIFIRRKHKFRCHIYRMYFRNDTYSENDEHIFIR